MQTNNRAAVVPVPPAHAVLPLGVQMQLRRAAVNGDLACIDAITDGLVAAGLVRQRGECAWMTRAEITRALAGTR